MPDSTDQAIPDAPAEPAPTVAGLFAGIGGLELGLHRAGFNTAALCEIWEPAREVLTAHFPGIPISEDVRTLPHLPAVDVVTAGFPCTDLSQAGRTAGIHGAQSGLVNQLFRLLADTEPRWVVIENIRNMLVLDQGQAMTYLIGQLEQLGYQWAYRLVDSRFTGVPQRRQRVIMVASKQADPRGVLFADDAKEPAEDWFADDVFGFYWTEGLRGLGWARDALPTLKGGSTIGIPSPPALWVRDAPIGRAIVTPGIRAGELLQGFPEGWTLPAAAHGRRNGTRWKLIGNAVTVGVAEWLGGRLLEPGTFDLNRSMALPPGHPRWPLAAWGKQGERWQVEISMWPLRRPYQHLLDVVDLDEATPLSRRASEGFFSRMEQSSLRFDDGFRIAMKEHVRAMQAQPPGL
ncbi:DNA cytosine methyltransferase [Dactylosporangium cerinum]|uniref:Cytosine-specific methyltransferase n=1 Tax=Dactylosporangium cerinum TaxID=1434730 RepID=A0ABV9W1K1_9ACTN